MSHAHRSDEKFRRNEVLKVQVLFDSGGSARRAKELMRRVCQTAIPTFALLQLNEDLMSNCGVEAARLAANANLLVVSVEADFDLPFFAKTWLARWISFRDKKQVGALVALVADDVAPPDADSQLAAYLETVAVVGGLEFFYRCARNHGGQYKIAGVALLPFAGSRLLKCDDRPTERWGINE
jgi:hypothetical protein